MLRRRTVCALSVSIALSACGGGVEDKSAPPVLTLDQNSCTTGAIPSAQEAAADLDPSDELAVAELFLLDECTGAGGHWVLGRELDSYRVFFLGAHGCRLWSTTPVAPFGVVRFRQTAGIFSTPEGACIAFAGERNARSDQSTSGVIAFGSRADAESFATARGWKPPGQRAPR
jgi:hypothetical protein